MKIEIHNAEQAEMKALLKAIERGCRYSNCTADHIEISVQPRGFGQTNRQWLEYGISVIKNNSVSIYIAMIQRTNNAEFEFHS